MKTQTQRIPEIDGIRGIAILLVLSFHFLNNQLEDATGRVGRAICQLTQFGWVGVDLFFVLSGFLIGRIILKNMDSPGMLRTFYIRRALKIIPNYYLLLLVFIVINCIPYFSGDRFLTGWYSIPGWSYFLMIHNFFMAAHHSLGNDPLGVTWSIGIEEQFYLVIPFLLIWQRKHIDKILLILIALGIFSRSLFTHWIPRYVLLNCRMDSLAIGVLISRVELNARYRAFVSDKLNLTRLLCLLIMVIVALVYWKYNDLGIWKHTVFALFFGLLVIMALFQDWPLLKKILSTRALTRIGEISYSLYLFHYLILGLVHHFFGEEGLALHNAKDALISLLAFILSIALAWLIYAKIETPFNAIGKRFKY